MRRSTVALVLALLACAGAAAAHAARKHNHTPPKWRVKSERHGHIRVWTIHYRAHTGVARRATIVLPAWYSRHNHPRIPLVISPHGRGISGRRNALLFAGLPAVGGFAVISPDGQGRMLENYSWGSPGQIEDLARMPEIARRALPWLRIDQHRIYAFGGSMGGQETLLLLARHPKLLAGAAAFDAVTDFARQYRSFPRLACSRACQKRWVGPVGRSLQALARIEVGGSPQGAPGAFAARSPLAYVRRIANSCVPLQLWWSNVDRIVIGQRRQTGHFFVRLRQTNPSAPVMAFRGMWRHSAEMRDHSRLPLALATFHLLPVQYLSRTTGLHVVPPPDSTCRRVAASPRKRAATKAAGTATASSPRTSRGRAQRRPGRAP
jgi:poly(3-hydroxybutyrate) depolymerase